MTRKLVMILASLGVLVLTNAPEFVGASYADASQSRIVTSPYDLVYRAAQVSVGSGHSCALTSDGAIKCWGRNFFGQLGNGTTAPQSTPIDVYGLGGGFRAVVSGDNHSCALSGGGGVKCWGYGSYGQLGDGTTTHRYTPVDVNGLSGGVNAISASGDKTCALTSGGGVKCWGNNTYGQLGDGTTTWRSSPVNVVDLSSGVTQIDSGSGHTCAITSVGGVKCWGYNLWGQLGDGTTTNAFTPVDVVGLGSGVRAISAGFSHTCAVLSTGGVKCWGANFYGGLGDGTATTRLSPVDVIGLGSGTTSVSAGSFSTCAVTTDGAAKCWGSNSNGRLGDGTTQDRYSPANVFGLRGGVVAISLASNACALTSAGILNCWGSNDDGQLGNGTLYGSLVPVGVVGFSTGIRISHIEVNQAIQDDNDAVPLVANKATLVRVYVDCTTRCGTAVSGNLQVRTSSGAIVPSTALNHSIVLEHPTNWTDHRGNLSKSLNFYIAPEFARGDATIAAVVDDNYFSQKSVSFLAVRDPKIVVVPIDYRPPSVGFCDYYPNTANRGPLLPANWARNLAPFPSLQPIMYQSIPFELDLKQSSNCDPNHRAEGELFRSLRIAGLMATSGTPDAVYGWLPDGALGGGLTQGMNWVGGRLIRPPLPIASFGDAGSESGRIFAHELLHTFLRPHTPAPTLFERIYCLFGTAPPLDPYWPYQDSKIQTWGVDLSASSVLLKDRSTTFDLMSYCGSQSDGNVWISPWTYTNALNELVARTASSVSDRLDIGTAITTSNYYLLSGLVFSTGLSTMDPVFTISKTDFSPPNGSQSPVCAQSLDVHGGLVAQQCLDLGDVDPTTDLPRSVSSYALLLPSDASVTELVIQKGGAVLVSRTLSTVAPTVSIVWPSGGSSWSASGTYTVSWTGSDTDGDLLTYSVLQSMDGGVTWTPISAAMTDTQVAIESAELPGGTQSRIRVIASDGFSTGADEVVLAIANKAPDVHILSPSDNSTIIDTELFHGDAYDIEDKSLSGLSLSWYSDRDGLIGQGTSFPAHLSAVGPHTITLTAIDSDGSMASDSVHVLFVGKRVFLPEAHR